MSLRDIIKKARLAVKNASDDNRRYVYSLPKLPEELQFPQTDREKQYKAFTDELLQKLKTDFSTGMLHAEEMNKQTKEVNSSYVYMMIDGDGLKKANDESGDHGVGDALIQALARGVQNAMRGAEFSTAKLARMGGDEFAVVIPGVDARTGTAIANRILASIQSQDVTNYYQGDSEESKKFLANYSPKASIGVGISKEQADAALYKAKENGRNRVEVFEQPKADPEAEKRLQNDMADSFSFSRRK